LAAGSDPVVAFNIRSLKFHHLDCDAAKACTVNCILISRSEALRRGGTPCKHCGGGRRLSPAPTTVQAIVHRASSATLFSRPAAQHV
jgi:methylphosphotriester-DNA--protein-cysteine methyltransferase